MHAHQISGSSAESLLGRFARDGYLCLDSITTPEDIAQIRSLLDPLFANFDSLGDRAVDLAGPRQSGTPMRSPEVNEAAVLVPALRQTKAFKRCRAIARELLGVPVGYQFDHAIYKPPHNNTATAWHQDEAYSNAAIPLRSIHFWIPLQPATIENGCMWFIPGSHRTGLVPHHVANIRTAGSSSRTVGKTIAADDVDGSKGTACPIGIGSATAHHPLTLHFTGPNQTDDYRRVWILHFGAYGRLRFLLHPKSVVARLRGVFGDGAAGT
jgi:hypothetical protein